MILEPHQVKAFAEEGNVVVPQVVSGGLVRAARREVGRLRAEDPPPGGHRGPHFYFPIDVLPPPISERTAARR